MRAVIRVIKRMSVKQQKSVFVQLKRYDDDDDDDDEDDGDVISPIISWSTVERVCVRERERVCI